MKIRHVVGLTRQETAIDGQATPGDHLRAVAEQEQDGAFDVCDFGESVQRNLGQHRPPHLGVAPNLPPQLRHHHRRVDTVDSDFLGAVLQRRGSSERINRPFGGAVQRVMQKSGFRRLRRDIDNRTGRLPLHHVLHHILGDVYDSFDVDRKHPETTKRQRRLDLTHRFTSRIFPP
jgi:hypothetical protein